MPISFFSPGPTDASNDRSIFLSASIPDPERWATRFDALEITDAVVALARECLGRGYRLVTAAHPTIAPLLLYVAAETQRPHTELPPIRVFQSMLFEDMLPTATRRYEAEGIGEITWTRADSEDEPAPGRWDRSLEIMRERMLRETDPVAAVFIGGMEGILSEEGMFQAIYTDRPIYAAGSPGGAATDLVNSSPAPVREDLRTSRSFPALWAQVFNDIEERRTDPHSPPL